MLISIGVDPGGSNSALAVITHELKVLKVAKAPSYLTFNKAQKNKPKLNKETKQYEMDYKKTHWTDFKLVGELIEPYLDNEIIYTIEKVATRPGEGEKNSFVFGNSLGIWQGLYCFIKPVEFYNPVPKVWKDDLGVTSNKKTSIELALSIFEEGLSKTDLKLVQKDDNVAEALLISFYGLRQYAKENNNG